jgi:hypothetical protein
MSACPSSDARAGSSDDGSSSAEEPAEKMQKSQPAERAAESSSQTSSSAAECDASGPPPAPGNTGDSNMSHEQLVDRVLLVLMKRYSESVLGNKPCRQWTDDDIEGFLTWLEL